MTAQEFADGLRLIASWYEEHPDMPMPYAPEIQVVNVRETKEEVARVARALGNCDKEYSSLFFKLVKGFGVINLKFTFYRDTVCTKRVIGTRVLPAQPAIPEREEEIVEWDCPESLLEGK